MKIILSVLILVSAFVVQASEPCLDQAYDVVNGLEDVWAKESGPIQGDYNKTPITHKLKELKDDLVTYAMEADHTNEDGETWYNKYEITMSKNWCTMDSYKFLGSVDTTPRCVDLDEAKKELNRMMGLYEGTVPVDLLFWLNEDDENDILTAAMMTQAEDSLSWDEYHEAYTTDILFSGYCAAGAECWAGFKVTCDGEGDVWQDGED